MWHNRSGRTPKSYSSLFDLEEVVQRQQQQPPHLQWCSGRRRAPSFRGQTLVEDDGFLKEPFGECLGLWRSACLEVRGAWGWSQSPSCVPGREALAAVGLPWDMEAACHSGKEEQTLGAGSLCVEGPREAAAQSRDQGLSSLARRAKVGSWHRTGPGSPLCSSDKASWCCARA